MRINPPQHPFCHNAILEADGLYQQGRCDAAVDLLLKAVAKQPGDHNLFYRIAELLIDSRQYQDALDILTKLPAGDEPGPADLPHGAKPFDYGSQSSDLNKMELVGYCHQGLGHSRKAEALADAMLAIKPDCAAALNLKAMALRGNGDLSAARVYFEKAIALDPAFAEAYTHLGSISLKLSRPEDALELYEKGFGLAPTVSHVVLAYHSAIVAQKAFARAESRFREARQRYPQNKRLRYLLIDLLIQQAKYDGAMREIEAAIVMFGIDDGILPAALKIRGRLGPLEIKAHPKCKTTVSLCMIVKNEELHLARCLASAKPLVDEMIVMDTGSDDRTRDIARAFGAKAYTCHWQEDFSKDRNESLSKARGQWLLILDADEVIAPCDHERIRKLIRNTAGREVAFAIETRNYTVLNNTVGWRANSERYADESAGTGWFGSVKVRLFPNDRDIRFEYPVHEMVEPCLKKMGIPIEPADIPVHHYGKLNQHLQEDKGRTYYDIGIKKLAEIGDNISALRELAVQAGNLEKWSEAIRLWRRLIRLQPRAAEPYINLDTAHWQLDQYEKALECARQAMALQPDLKEAHFNYAINLLYLAKAEKAVAVLENLIEHHPQYLAARFMLTAAYSCAGNKEKAMESCRRMQQTEIGSVLAVSFHDLTQKLVAADAIGYATAVLETAVECQSFDENLLPQSCTT